MCRDVAKVGAEQPTGMWGELRKPGPGLLRRLTVSAEPCSGQSVLWPQTDYSCERLAFSYRSNLSILGSSPFSDGLELWSDSEVSKGTVHYLNYKVFSWLGKKNKRLSPGF